jgi:cell division protease FtsH
LLVDREVIFADDVEAIFGKRPWTSRSEELLEAQMRADAERMAEERAKELALEAKNHPEAPEVPEVPEK